MSPSSDERQFYAETYDVCVGDWEGELAFYLEQLKKHAQSPPCRVLEIACGTGRIAIRLAEAGAEVVGLDLYNPILEIARRKSRGMQNIRWVQADMRQFDLNRIFDLVIIPGHSFQNLNEPEEQASCLESIHRHIKPHGCLIMHLDHQEYGWLAEIGAEKQGVFEPAEEFTHPVTGNRVRTERAWSFFRASQTAVVQTVWREFDAEGGLIRQVDTGPIPLHCLFHHEAVHLLERSGFEVTEVYGDFVGSSLDDESGQMIFEARARSPELL